MTNEENTNTPDTFASHLSAVLADQAAIPPHIAGNLLEFLRRVQSTGMEAVAWVEGVPQFGAEARPATGGAAEVVERCQC